MDALRAVRAVGLEDPRAVTHALAAVVGPPRGELARFDACVARFFSAPEEPRGFWARLRAAGFSAEELAALESALTGPAPTADLPTLGVLLERGPQLTRLLATADVRRALESMQSAAQAGFFTHRVAQAVGLGRGRSALAALQAPLTDALGPARADALLAALRDELRRAEDDVRAHVRSHAERLAREPEERTARTTPFAELDPTESVEVRRALSELAQRLRGRQRVRRRHGRRGGIDPHRTLRRATRTLGVPFVPVRRTKRDDRPRLLLLCDVSDSVRASASFLLQLVAAAHDLWEDARSFVFVSDLAEATELFRREPPERALAHAYGGGLVSVKDNSHYGRALALFEERHGRHVDSRTTLVILGDARSNYQEPGAEVLARLAGRARAVLWLNPEPRSRWHGGDSAIAAYAPHCTAVLEVRTAADLEAAARSWLVARRGRASVARYRPSAPP